MMRNKLGRWAAPLGAGLCFFLVLALALGLHFKYAEAGLATLVGQGFLVHPVKVFIAHFVLTPLLPFYLAVAFILWCLALIWASVFVRNFSNTWTAMEGFLTTLAALGWVHLVLWWEVPSTLWLLPGLRRLPFWILLPLLLAAILAYPVRWARRKGLGWIRGTALVAGWLLLWCALPWTPSSSPGCAAPQRAAATRLKS